MAIAPSIVAAVVNASVVARVQRRLPQFRRAAISPIAIPIPSAAIVVSIPIPIPVTVAISISISIIVTVPITVAVVVIVVSVWILGIVTMFKRYLEIATIEISVAEPRIVILRRIAISAKTVVVAITVARVIGSLCLRSVIQARVERLRPQV